MEEQCNNSLNYKRSKVVGRETKFGGMIMSIKYLYGFLCAFLI